MPQQQPQVPPAPHPSPGGPGPAAAARTVPPSTPPVALADLLARTDLGLRQIAGPREGVAIHWVHTSEMADPVPYLLGGEMLLTAGMHLAEAASGTEEKAEPTVGTGADTPTGAGTAPETEAQAPPPRPTPSGPAPAPDASPDGLHPGSLDAYLDGYVARTVAAGAAALGFGIAPVHDTVPRALVAACDRHGLPLDRGAPGHAVHRRGERRLAGRDGGQAPRADPAQRGPAGTGRGRRPPRSRTGRPARPGPPCARLDRPAHPRRHRARHRRPPPTAACRAAAAHLAGVVGRGGPSSATDTLPDAHLTAYALTGRGPRREAPALVVAAHPLDPPAHTIAGVAAVLLSLITGPAADAGQAGADHSAALAELLLGARPAEVGPLLGHPLWAVVHAEPRRDTAASPAALAAALDTPLVARCSTAAPGPAPPARAEAGSERPTAPHPASSALRALVPADRELTGHPGWTFGVSEAVPVAELPAADRHAASALRRALARRVPLVQHRPPGPHGITALVAPSDARHHAQALLAPLTGSSALLSTLHNWLSLHGNWDRTATALGIHRNTVRQRIARIAGLLDTDLDDPDVRMELWFALRALDRGTPQEP